MHLHANIEMALNYWQRYVTGNAFSSFNAVSRLRFVSILFASCIYLFRQFFTHFSALAHIYTQLCEWKIFYAYTCKLIRFWTAFLMCISFGQRALGTKCECTHTRPASYHRFGAKSGNVRERGSHVQFLSSLFSTHLLFLH